MSQGPFSQEFGGVDLVNLICLLGYARVPFVYTYSSQFVFCGGLTGMKRKKYIGFCKYVLRMRNID